MHLNEESWAEIWDVLGMVFGVTQISLLTKQIPWSCRKGSLSCRPQSGFEREDFLYNIWVLVCKNCTLGKACRGTKWQVLHVFAGETVDAQGSLFSWANAVGFFDWFGCGRTIGPKEKNLFEHWSATCHSMHQTLIVDGNKLEAGHLLLDVFWLVPTF